MNETIQTPEEIEAYTERLKNQAKYCIPPAETVQTEKLFTICLDTVNFIDKPKGNQVGKIKQRLANGVTKITLVQFIESVKHGCTYVPAEVTGEQISDNWKSKQIFCVDIDNKTDPKSNDYMLPKKALNICQANNIKPFFLYHTFSSTEELQKYRICFVLDKLVTNKNEREVIITPLINLFKPVSDSVCKDAARLFFAGRKDCSIYENLQAVISKDTIIKISQEQQALPAPELSEHHSKGFKTEYANQTYNFDWAKEFKANPDQLLLCIDPAEISYNEWISVTASYKVACGSFEFWKNWNISGNTWNEKADTKTWKKLSGKDITEGTLKFFAQQKQKGKDYMDSLRYSMEQAKQEYKQNKKKMQSSKLPSYIYTKENARGEIKYKISCPLLADYIRRNRHYIFVRNEAFDTVRCYLYSDGCYRLITDEELKGYIKSYITDFNITILEMKDVNEVFHDLITDRNFVNESLLNSDELIINFQNGLLYLDKMELRPHTPDILSTIQIPCNWNPNAVNSPIFDSFLDTFTDNNKDKKISFYNIWEQFYPI